MIWCSWSIVENTYLTKFFCHLLFLFERSRKLYVYGSSIHQVISNSNDLSKTCCLSDTKSLCNISNTTFITWKPAKRNILQWLLYYNIKITFVLLTKDAIIYDFQQMMLVFRSAKSVQDSKEILKNLQLNVHMLHVSFWMYSWTEIFH